jgi:ammonia channel protein AmtB
LRARKFTFCGARGKFVPRANLKAIIASKHADDSIDVFVVHGVDGILNSLMLAWLKLPVFSGLRLDAASSATSQFGIQLISGAITVSWTFIASMIISY